MIGWEGRIRFERFQRGKRLIPVDRGRNPISMKQEQRLYQRGCGGLIVE